MWLVERGCGWDVRVMEQAAKTDNMAILKWARAQGCPWEPSLCAIAARAEKFGSVAVAARGRLSMGSANPLECGDLDERVRGCRSVQICNL